MNGLAGRTRVWGHCRLTSYLEIFGDLTKFWFILTTTTLRTFKSSPELRNVHILWKITNSGFFSNSNKLKTSLRHSMSNIFKKVLHHGKFSISHNKNLLLNGFKKHWFTVSQNKICSKIYFSNHMIRLGISI